VGDDGRVKRGSLRIYLGAAPGVGKTFAMLDEGRRRADRGTDVVLAFVETHGRPRTAEQVEGLEVVPRRMLEHRGASFEEMDVEAVLARRPEVALVDELAHTNVPGSAREKRWQDVDELLDAGIDVISTVNVQHLESLNDVVEQITGVTQRETVPDAVVRAADQVELVDMTPEALRRRMAHGNVYGAEQIDAALANYFRAGNLSALRELALLWVADRVDEALAAYREGHGITDPWETRERVVVAITGAPGGDRLIRRAARIAQRAHGELLGVHVRSDSGLAGPANELLAEHRRLLDEMGGSYRELAAADVGASLAAFARSENATQVVLGASRRSRWQELAQGSVINRVVRQLGPGIDAHVISPDPEDEAHGRRSRSVPVISWYQRLAPVSGRRQAWGWALTLAGLPLLTVVLTSLRSELDLAADLPIYLLLVVGVALVGGLLPGLAAAVGASLLLNWFFTEPHHQLRIADPENLVAVLVFLVTAGSIAVLVDRSARRGLEAVRARAEAEALAGLVGQVAEDPSLPVLIETLRTTFGLDGVSLLRRTDDGWSVEAQAGPRPPAGQDDADLVRSVSDDEALALTGGPLSVEDQRVLGALVAQMAIAVRTRRLSAEAHQAHELAEANDLRSALLQAVSHDLRTPLASVKASISSLRQPDVRWSPEDVEQFHRTIDEEVDRLIVLVANLLDMSRIQAGVLEVVTQPVGLDDVVAGALQSLGPVAAEVEVRVPAELPPVAVDPALLERAVANVVGNAVRAGAGKPVRVEAGTVGSHVDLRVVDRGPGIPAAERERVFEPFQRLTDHGVGVGLGLAITRGFVEAMRGELELDDTPGGGLTVLLRLPPAVGSLPTAAEAGA
jgi:two-component system sensor histidine kinase KdpD